MTGPGISILAAALRCRCPRCGKGKLFKALLTLRPACSVCGLDFSKSDTGDAGAVILIMVLGAFVVVMAFWVEFHFSPPLWVHAVLWPLVTVPLAILITRPMKAALVAAQFRHRPHEMGL
ncbi:MAG TPA: hypothetical protein DDZ81_23160 [Acetobacteraceae bacterium]|jgi:uncharacterized protein (DUF983 family)|nr:hypothetical protein [Acetobacteraceae bacterium]